MTTAPTVGCSTSSITNEVTGVTVIVIGRVTVLGGTFTVILVPFDAVTEMAPPSAGVMVPVLAFSTSAPEASTYKRRREPPSGPDSAPEPTSVPSAVVASVAESSGANAESSRPPPEQLVRPSNRTATAPNALYRTPDEIISASRSRAPSPHLERSVASRRTPSVELDFARGGSRRHIQLPRAQHLDSVTLRRWFPHANGRFWCWPSW